MLKHSPAARSALLPVALAVQLACGCALAATALPAAAQQVTITFDVPAGPLADALNRYAQQAGVALALDADKVRDLRTAGLQGHYAIDEGFNLLLRDSPYAIGRTAAGYVLQPKSATPAASSSPAPGTAQSMAPVTVTSTLLADELAAVHAGGQVARGAQLGMLGNTKTIDAPFSITAYTAGLIEDQQAATVGAVLVNDPSVRFTTSDGHIYENFSIRGFDINGEELAFNGLFGIAPNGHAPTELFERVEVLKGPGALLGGMAPQGAVGGVINLVPKRAGDQPLTRVTADYVSDAQFGGHVDVARRFGAGNRFGVRFNGGWRDGETGVDDQEKERKLAAVALDYRGERLTASVDAYTSRESIDNGSAWMASFGTAGVIAPPATNTNLLRGIYGRLENDAVATRASYEFNDTFTAFAALGKLRYRYLGYINGTRALLRNPAGDYTGNTFHQRGGTDTLSGEAGVRARFVTGGVRHQLVASFTSLDFDIDRANPVTSAAYGSNIYRPAQPALAAAPGPAFRVTETTLSGFALADTLAFANDSVLLTLGARHQQVKTTNFNATGAVTARYDESTVTPASGIVFKPWGPEVSFYANYIEGLSQGGTVTDTTAANFGEVFAPYKSKQLEAGVKWERGDFGNTLSVFRIERPSIVKDTASNTYTDDGNQRNRGVEWATFGQLGGVRVLGGAAYTQAAMTRAATAALTGKTVFGVPKWKANLGADWTIPGAGGLAVNGRVVYTSEQWVNSANTQRIPGWTRVDVGARYALRFSDRTVQLRANVENVADRSYWAGSFNDGYVTQGAGRLYKLSAAVEF